MPLHHVILLKALLCSYELNTLDACWIAVDVWSNSSRCRQESVYLSRTWCLYTWSYLDILITMLSFINCLTVICSPTVILMLSSEKPLVKPMAPGSIFHHINLPTTSYFWRRFYFAFFTLHLYHKNTKNIISIRPHPRKWPWRDWQPLIALVASSYRFVQVRGTWAWPPTGLIPWFSKTEGNTYATLLHHPFLFGENQRKLKT